MKSSSQEEKSSRQKQQTIRVPMAQVTGEPVRGYTTKDFWRDIGEKRPTAPNTEPEFERFAALTGKLIQVPKAELDEKRQTT